VVLLTVCACVKVFSSIMTLRKLCNHPDLVTNEYSVLVTSGGGEGARSSGERVEEDEEGSFDIIPVSDKAKSKGRKRKAKKTASADSEDGRRVQ